MSVRIPTPLDPALIAALEQECGCISGWAATGCRRWAMMPGMFAKAGIPAAMVLVRNQNGSHNPAEALDQADYAAGVRVLAQAAVQMAGGSTISTGITASDLLPQSLFLIRSGREWL